MIKPINAKKSKDPTIFTNYGAAEIVVKFF